MRSPLAWQVASHQEISRCIGTGSPPVPSTTRDEELQTPASAGSAGSNLAEANIAGRPDTSAALHASRSAASGAPRERRPGGSLTAGAFPLAPAPAETAPARQRPQFGVLGDPAIEVDRGLDVGVPEACECRNQCGVQPGGVLGPSRRFSAPTRS